MVSISRMLSAHGTKPSAKTIVSTAASLAATAMVIRSIARDLLPHELRNYVISSIQNFFRSFSSEVILIIERKSGLSTNQIYKAAKVYLGTKISPHTNKFVVSMASKESKISTSMAKNDEAIVDHYNGASLQWRQITRVVAQSEICYLELRFHKKHKNMVLEQYFPYILSESKSMKEERKTLRIYTLKGDPIMRRHSDDGSWSSMKLEHPATFATLAMDTEMKKRIIDDLDMFVRRKDFYRKVGKAWKRGYLLYGPPGTGKSSLIAAMANYLNFDVYDLELAGICSNADLRKLLIKTGNRSILVVEDIDCSLNSVDDDRNKEEEDRALKMPKKSCNTKTQTLNIVQKDHKSNQVTLSGLLNLTDGLWSSCGDERIIVFTTNHKDRLDPALLRPGRMDMHIHMSYCSPCAFRILAANYHGINDYHSLFDEIEGLLGVAMVTPAEVGEHLLRSDNVDVAFRGLIQFLQGKITESGEQELESAGEDENGEEITVYS